MSKGVSTSYVQMLKNVDKLPIFTDIDTLDIYCEYLLNDTSKYINYANMTNLQEYIVLMDSKVIMSNDAKMARYEFIKCYLEAKLDKGIVSRKLCLGYVNDNIDSKYNKIIQREILGSIEPDQLKRKDIEFINDMVFAQLNVSFMHKYKLPLTKMMEDLNVNNFGKTSEDCNDAIQLFQLILNDLSKAQRRSKQDNRFNLTDVNHFKAIMTEACNRFLSDSQYWQTGWAGLNKMIGGGFENSRIYNFIGATGGFKSGLLLNIMKTIKMNNRGREHKDPNKRPTVLFVSQENNIWETILRIFGIFGTTRNIKEFTVEEIIEIMANGGFSIVQDELDIDIEFRYYGNMDIGVPDLRGICEELDNSGREVVCIIQDYIERLRPPMMTVEKRVQLFDISNQMHDLAIELDIPIITGSQLNRTGVSTIETMRNSGKVDIGKNIGSGDISESFAMLKNFDVNISIVIEYDSAEERFYLSFRRLKFRGDDSTSIEYFLQPFVGTNSKIQLMEDINMDKPVYRLTLLDEAIVDMIDDAKSMENITRKKKTLMDPLVDIDDVVIEDFLDTLDEDVKKSKADFQRDYFRDEDGFIVLVRKDLMGLKFQVG